LASSNEDKLIIISQKLKSLHRECDNLQNEILELRTNNSQIQKNLSSLSQKNEEYLKLKENYGILQKSLNSSIKLREQQKAMILLLRSTIADNTKSSPQVQVPPKLEPNRQSQKNVKDTNGSNPPSSLFDSIPSPLNMKLRSQGSIDESKLQDKSRPPTKKRTDDSSKASSSSQNHPHSPIHSSSRLKASSQPRQASHDGGTSKATRHHKARSGKAFRPFQLQDHPYYKRNASSQPRQLPDSSSTADNTSLAHNLSSSNSSDNSSGDNDDDENNLKKHKPKGKKSSRVLSQSESRKIRPSEILGGTSGAH